jgi:hypothetical protein
MKFETGILDLGSIKPENMSSDPKDSETGFHPGFWILAPGFCS